MKLLLSVIALAIATPALAQNAPAAAHAGHAQHAEQAAPAAGTACSPEHAAMGHCTPKQSTPAAPAGQPAEHQHGDGCCEKDANGKMACCEKARAAGRKMDCCKEPGGAAAATPSDHAGH
jgi:hypothetical protein